MEYTLVILAGGDMAGTDFFDGNEDFKTLNDELIVKYDSATVESLWKKISQTRENLLAHYAGEKKNVRAVLERLIPYVACYLVLRDDNPDDAMELVAEQSKANAVRKRRWFEAYAKKHPKLYNWKFRGDAKNWFDTQAGFSLAFKGSEKNECAFEVSGGPYGDLCRDADCPELEEVFLAFDRFAFQGLPDVKFSQIASPEDCKTEDSTEDSDVSEDTEDSAQEKE